MIIKRIILLSFLIVGVIFPTKTIMAETKDSDTSSIVGEVVNGGMTIELKGNTANEQTPKDVHLGTRAIGQKFSQVKILNMITIVDHTGSDGWKLNARVTNYNETQMTISNNLTLETESVLAYPDSINLNSGILTSSDYTYADGLSQRDPIILGGTILPEWGATPKAGNYSQHITWTLIPKITDESAR